MSDLTIDVEYIQRLSCRLEQFQNKRKDLWFARCPFCGDSKVSKYKKRFYIYFRDGHYSAKCHNCGFSQPFKVFLETFAPDEYQKYCLDQLPKRKKLNRFSKHVKDVLPEKFVCKGFDYSSLTDFRDLHKNHPARLYVENRKIPFDYVLYCKNFSDFIKSLEIERYNISYSKSTEPRLIIPFYREDGLSTVFQARSFSKKEKLRYITIKEHDDELKIFGLDRIDKSLPVFCTEGPLDSLMIPNCIAMSGISTKLPKDINIIYIFDNEPRNIDVVKNMKKRLLFGDNVVILPDSIKYKDLNDMIVKGGLSKEKVLDIINDNVYNHKNGGILRINSWAKVG